MGRAVAVPCGWKFPVDARANRFEFLCRWLYTEQEWDGVVCFPRRSEPTEIV
jgi:hypothetical protein